ncbi:MAG: EamA family transporter [Leeuwenhoekiella sp.]
MYLLCSIFSSTVIFIIFKLFSKFEIDRLQAIIINYVVACTLGLMLYDYPIVFSQIISQPWSFGAIILGLLFILVFYLMSFATSRSGIAVVSVATKMSVVIPIIFGVIYFEDRLGILKLLGIVLALSAVYLTSIKQQKGLVIQKEYFILPFLVFLGSGIIDTSLKFLESAYVAKHVVPLFSALIFIAAFAVGIVILIFKFFQGRLRFSPKNVVAGIALGVPNYFSIYFLIQALRNGWESSTVFLLNNVGIVVLSTFAGLLFFKEKMLVKNWIGLGLAVAGILLVSFSK